MTSLSCGFPPMPIASGANPWPKSYWTKPVEKEVPPAPRRERASIAEGFLVEKRRRFVKQRSVPVTSYDASSSSVVFVHPQQLTASNSSQAPAAEAGDEAVWEDEKQMMAIPGFSSSSSVLRSKQRQAVKLFCPTLHQETIDPDPSVSINNEEDETKKQTNEDDKEDSDTTICSQQHTLSITVRTISSSSSASSSNFSSSFSSSPLFFLLYFFFFFLLLLSFFCSSSFSSSSPNATQKVTLTTVPLFQ